MDLLEPIEQIISIHHVYLRRVLPEILREAGKAHHSLQNAHSQKLFEGVALLHEELHKHMLKEEVILFPAILEVERAAEGGTKLDLTRYDIQNPLEQMECEHQAAEQCLADIDAAGEKIEWKKKFPLLYKMIYELKADLSAHVQLEEKTLFTQAREIYFQVMKRQ